MYKQKMNKELKDYLYMLVGSILTPNDYRKVLDYFNQLKQERDHYKNKTLVLQERIVNTICYIKNNIDKLKEEHLIIEFTKEELYTLIDILKGEDIK